MLELCNGGDILRVGDHVEGKKGFYSGGVCRKDIPLDTVFGLGPWQESGM